MFGEFANKEDRVNKKGRGTFYFKHTNTPIWPPTGKYDTRGEFLYFKEYDVEARSRVMLISGMHGMCPEVSILV